MHSRFLGRATAFLSIAAQTRAHHVLPDGGSPLRAWDDMIEIQIRPWRDAPAILAGVAITRIDVETTETHMALRHAIIRDEQDDARHSHRPIDEAYGLVADRAGKRRPALEVEGLVLLVHGASDTLVKKRARAPDRGDVDRQVGPVQNQDLGVQYRRGLEEETSAGSSTFRTLTVGHGDVKLTARRVSGRGLRAAVNLVALHPSRSYTPPPSDLGLVLPDTPSKMRTFLPPHETTFMGWQARSRGT